MEISVKFNDVTLTLKYEAELDFSRYSLEDQVKIKTAIENNFKYVLQEIAMLFSGILKLDVVAILVCYDITKKVFELGKIADDYADKLVNGVEPSQIYAEYHHALVQDLKEKSLDELRKSPFGPFIDGMDL